MSRPNRAHGNKNTHPLAIAHGLIAPLARQGQALTGYHHVLSSLPDAALESQARDLSARHLNHGKMLTVQAFHHTTYVLNETLTRYGKAVLPPPEPYPILSTLTLMQHQLVDSLKALSFAPGLGPPSFDPLVLPLPVTDWSSFSQTRFQVSPAEGAMIAQFIEGATIPQVARTLSRGKETVRTQSQNARAKVAYKTKFAIPNITRLVAVVLLTRIRELSGGLL